MSERSMGVGRKRKDAPYPSPHQRSDRKGEVPGNWWALLSHITYLQSLQALAQRLFGAE